MLIMDSVVIPRPPALPPAPPTMSSTCSGFRLMEDQGDTGSVYSIYKQKIDAMFESDSSGNNTKNVVQARIEKMFSDVARDGPLQQTEGGLHSFSVDYLGSVGLSEKVTSLAGLQSPLKELYFAYKKNTKPRKSLTGRLEISGQGLKVLYQGEKGDLEQLNSFPTIAVWSAVKFVIQDCSTYAFLPLITDPDNIDKKALFRELNDNEKKYITTEAHSPLFAVVMRKIGVQKQLECHGFVCQTSEDAIVIAATLYKSLMAHMKAKEKKPKNRNGITCMSIASSTFNEKTSTTTPVRPPRKKRSTASSVISETENMDTSDTQPLLQQQKKKSTKPNRAPKTPDDFDAILPYEEPVKDGGDDKKKEQEIKPKTFSDKISTYMSREQKQITAEIKQVMSESANKGLKHVQQQSDNVRTPEEDALRTKDNQGDILTKVTIPRSGSFLNAGGLTRYKSKVSRSNGQATGGSPLGFNELFNEFRLQEGLHSMDEILGVIIDPEGMSFNDLKPIYKEFLLKLSVTLTKDELYQRSKLIMRRHKKKLMRRNSSLQSKNTHHILVSNKFKRLKHIFQKNLKLKLCKPKMSDVPEHEVKLPESSISTSSYDTRQFSPKEEQQPSNNNHKRNSYYSRKKSCPMGKRDRTSTSEESDFFSLRRRNKSSNTVLNNNHLQNRNSSSGYVSCSECSYDSDTCTCVSADKCYCSLGTKNHNRRYPCDCHVDTTVTFCGCDTDSCTESNKCYCQNVHRRPVLVHEQRKHKKLCRKLSNSKSTKSLEYMHRPMEAYYEKLNSKRRRSSRDYDLFSARNGSTYATVFNDAVQKQASLRSYGSSRYGSSKRMLQSTAISGVCTEALSVKKSAEIAALFADIKLSQTTDIAHLTPRTVDMDAIISSRNAYNRLKSSQNFFGGNNRTEIKTVGHYGQKMMMVGRGAGTNSKMYSARNGLYTIQSQSDESRRSSVSEEKRDYFDLEATTKNMSSNLENSLGYLP